MNIHHRFDKTYHQKYSNVAAGIYSSRRGISISSVNYLIYMVDVCKLGKMNFSFGMFVDIVLLN